MCVIFVTQTGGMVVGRSTARDSHFLCDLALPALQSMDHFPSLMMEDILTNNIMTSSASKAPLPGRQSWRTRQLCSNHPPPPPFALEDNHMSLDDFFALCASLKRNPYGCKLYPSFASGRASGRARVTVTLNDQNHMGSTCSPTRLILERKLKRPIKPGYFAVHSCRNPRVCPRIIFLRAEALALMHRFPHRFPRDSPKHPTAQGPARNDGHVTRRLHAPHPPGQSL
jgi:hypothetical protein